MNTKKVTLRSIAKEVGVSVSTVSRALSGDLRVSEQTRRNILEAAKGLGYFKDTGVILNKRKIIALVLTDVTNPFFPEVIQGVEDLAFESGFLVSLWNTREDIRREDLYLKALGNLSNLVGVILASSRLSGKRVLAAGRSSRVPWVLINRIIPDFYSVVVDYESGVYQAMKYLYTLGHRKIALVNGPSLAQPSLWRENGYLRFCRENGLIVPPGFVTNNPPVIEGGYVATLQLISRGDPPTAIIAYNDLVALGVMKAVKEKGMSVPRDISVIGCDDIFICPYLDPSLTTISNPKYTIGRIAMDLLLRLIRNERVQNNPVRVRPDLVIRSSCAGLVNNEG